MSSAYDELREKILDNAGDQKKTLSFDNHMNTKCEKSRI